MTNVRNREKIQDAELEARSEKYKNVIQNITLMSDIFIQCVVKPLALALNLTHK